MNVRLFQYPDSIDGAFFALSSDGALVGYTLSNDLWSCQWQAPSLLQLRESGAQEVEKERAKRLLRAINRAHGALDLHYGLPVRTFFRAERREDMLNPPTILAVFADLPASAIPGETRVLAYELASSGGRFFPARRSVVMSRFRAARPDEYGALKALLEREYFPHIRPMRFLRSREVV